MSRLRRKMFILLFIFIIFVSMFIMAAFLNSPGRLTPLKDTQGNIIPGSVSEKVWIEINGIKQGMFIRGRIYIIQCSCTCMGDPVRRFFNSFPIWKKKNALKGILPFAIGISAGRE